MGVYIYCLREDYIYKSNIKDRKLENDWFKLKEDGTVTVLGSNGNGYAWDGCSIKMKISDIYFGTPEGVLNYETGKSKTYYASMIHDVFYQFSKDVKSSITRKEVDDEFYRILKRDGFFFAKVYYLVVRLVAWLFW